MSAQSPDRPADSCMPQFGLAGFGEFTPRNRVGPCTWPHLDFLTLHSGRLALRIMGADRVLEAGESVLIYPDTDFGGHTLTPRSEASVIHVTLPPPEQATALPEPLRALAGVRGGYRHARLPAAVLEQDIPRLVQLCRHPGVPAREAQRLALLTLLAAAYDSPAATPALSARAQRLRPAVARLQRDLSRPPGMTELASLCGLSPSHFRAEFRAQFGRSPQAFLQNARLSEAARLLRETRRPIKAIAQAVGYAQVKDFYRAFGGHFQLTPAAYRRAQSPVG